MATIAQKIHDRADWMVEADTLALRDAVQAAVDLGERLRRQGAVGGAFADEILLALAKPLGLRIERGPYAQLVDLDPEEG